MWFFQKSSSIKESGLLREFTDFHCHLLPAVDDGVQKTAETFQILETWEKYGVRAIWLTPHIMEDFPNETETLKKRFKELLQSYNGSIELHLAAENMMDNLFNQRLQTKDILPLGTQKKHLLVETSYFNPPYGLEQTLTEIAAKGFHPVLAHPERYQYMNIGDYKKLKDKNIRFQLNLPSLVGAYGKTAQQKAEMLLDKDFYDLCGTDTHSLKFVKFFLDGKLSNKRIRQVEELFNKHTHSKL